MNDKSRKQLFKSEELQNEFELKGYVVVPLLSNEEIHILQENYNKNISEKIDGFYSTSFNKDEKLKQTLTAAIENVVEAKAQQLFKPYQALGSCYLVKAPGEKGEMPLHQDWTVVDEEKFDSITIWSPLCDVNEQNGAMQVVPGSHRFSKAFRSPFYLNPLANIQSELRADLVSVHLKAGEAIIFSQALIHASPANQSNESRVVITYGLIDEEAELFFYYKNEEEKGEKYKVPIDFFKKYNTQIGEKPAFGSLIDTFDLKEERFTAESYKLAKIHYQIKQNRMQKMIPIFKSKEHQDFFEKEGYLTLPLISEEDVAMLKDYYSSLQLTDEQGFGFHVSMDGLTPEKSKEVRDNIWGIIMPKLDQYLENYKPFVASYVVKESNPKGVVPAHQDWSFVDDEDEGFFSMTCWTALVDTYLDNGCMGVIKGSHKIMQNKRPSPSPQTPVPLGEHMFSIFPYLTTLEMKAGEVLFFDNRTFHASPPNTEDHIRLAVGVGVTQKDAQLVHYHLKPDGTKKTIQKYAIDEDFFLSYNNARLAKMFDNKEGISDYKLLGEGMYAYDSYTSEELVKIFKSYGNEFNVPMCEKLSVLFGYDMSGKKQEEPEEASETGTEALHEGGVEKSFFQTYTPLNILREVKFRITGK